MTEAIIAYTLQQLGSILAHQIKFAGKQVSLVGDVEEEVDKLTHNLRAIQAVLLDAEQKQMKDAAVRVWLDRLKDGCYDVEDVLDEWKTAILKWQIEGVHEHNDFAPEKKMVCFLFSFPCFGIKEIVLRRDIAIKISEINKKLDAIAKAKDDYNLTGIQTVERVEYKQLQTTSFIDVSNICGRDDEKSTLVSKLLCESSEKQEGLQIISLVGMGGIGKTTLAQFAYNNKEVKSNFDKRIWVCVSDPFDEFRVAKAILESLEGSTPNVGELQSLLEHICDSVMGQKIFLVLDDVWMEDYDKWESFYRCLKNGLPGSKILITTRKESVVRMMNSIDIINVKELSFKKNWWLFSKLALSGRSPDECEKLGEIGMEIVKKCKGLPLATKTIGSLLRFKRTTEEWQHVLDSEMWELEEIERGLLSPLMLSYNDLPSMIRRCFLYCSVFPKDYDILINDLIRLWMSQNYLGLEKDDKEMQMKGREYFNHLAARSFFQDFKKDFGGEVTHCKMHDIVHDFARYLSNNESLAVEINGVEDPFTNSSDKKVRHLMLTLNKRASFPMSICSLKSLRTLMIDCKDFNSLSLGDLSKLFNALTCLRTLKITSYVHVIEEIPEEIRKLIHLKYLNLFGDNRYTEIKKLPESLCELCNLQTLDISCNKVVELPQGIEKLVNLRHLINRKSTLLSYMPKGIETLTNLRTLSEFVVNGVSDDKSNSCTLEGLKNLNNLEGSLEIRGLGNPPNVREDQMTEVLRNKKNLTSLCLQFDGHEKCETCSENDELVLENLQPPMNLEKLSIYLYCGNNFPSYLMTSTSLTKLKELDLSHWLNCDHLRPLGKLPSLEMLTIRRMDSVKIVDNKFWGIEHGVTSSSSSSFVLFPRLKSLSLRDMKEWEEWEHGEDERIMFMPCLATFQILRCPKLRALPKRLLQTATLKELYIARCAILSKRYNMQTGEDWEKISHIRNIGMDGECVQGERFFGVVKGQP